jgi:hypothetical protein
MGIQVECPNGHSLNVKDKYAGKNGFCPICNAKIHVPAAPAVVSEDDVLALLSSSVPAAPVSPAAPSPARTSPSEYVFDDPPRSASAESSGLSLLGSSMIRRKKICTNCGNLVSFAFALCPKCGSALNVHSDAVSPVKPK